MGLGLNLSWICPTCGAKSMVHIDGQGNLGETFEDITSEMIDAILKSHARKSPKCQATEDEIIAIHSSRSEVPLV